jgi:hypothetical protein
MSPQRQASLHVKNKKERKRHCIAFSLENHIKVGETALVLQAYQGKEKKKRQKRKRIGE